MKLKKFKVIKIILLKIFVLQHKSKLNFNIKLTNKDLVFLIFLWKSGYILGFSYLNSNIYSVFLKKQFKQFSINFFENSIKSSSLGLYHSSSSINTPIILSHKGIQTNALFTNNIGGFLLCNIF